MSNVRRVSATSPPFLSRLSKTCLSYLVQVRPSYVCSVYIGEETIPTVFCYFRASPLPLRRLSDKAIFVFPSGYIPTDDELRAMTPEVQRTAEFRRKEAKRLKLSWTLRVAPAVISLSLLIWTRTCCCSLLNFDNCVHWVVETIRTPLPLRLSSSFFRLS